MGYKFSLVLSRVITDEESAVLIEAGCSAAVFGTDSLPTDAAVTVTKMDFDDGVSPTLAEAIESALEAVKSVPELSVPGLSVPAQPAGPVESEPGVVAGEIVEEVAVEEVAVDPSAEEAPAKKASTRKASTRKKAGVSADPS